MILEILDQKKYLIQLKKYYNLDKFDTELNIKNKFKLDKYEAFILMVMHDKNRKSRQIINYLKNTQKCFDVFSQLQ